jgi:hypothetical protein
MAFDFNKLRGRIKECFGSEKAFAAAMGMSPSNLSARLNCKIHFGGEEIKQASVLLKITDEEIGAYFFQQKFDVFEH